MSFKLAKCRICQKKRKTKSLYEKVKVSDENIKYLPEIIENISGVKITAVNDPRATICCECTDSILQAEVIIEKCRESGKQFKEINVEVRAGSNKDETNEEVNVNKEFGWNNEEEKVIMKRETVLIKECVENVIELETEIDLTIGCENEEPNKKFKRKELNQSKEKIIEKRKIPKNSKNARKLRLFRKNRANKQDYAKSESDSIEKSIPASPSEMYASSDNDHVDYSSKNNKSTKPSNKSLRKYVRTVNKNKDFFFRCDQCSYTSKFATHFREHMQQTHNIPQPRIFKCSLCIKDFREYRYLKQHIAHDHQNEPTSYKYLCSECGRCFVKSCNLKYHQRTHLPEHQRTQVPTVSCEFCSKTYSQHSIRMHVLTIHAAERPHACSLCQAAFAVVKGLQAHMRTCHPADILRCPCCEVKFRVKSVYEAHVKRGGCQKLGFNCDFCAWGFKTRERLEKHKLNVHKNVLHLQ